MKENSEAGFTLVEVLVAFAILAGAILMSFQIFANGMRRLTAVEASTKQMNVARLELARISISGNIAAGVTAGVTNGVSWRIVATPLNNTASSAPSNLMPFKVEVHVTDQGRKNGDAPIIETILIGQRPRP